VASNSLPSSQDTSDGFYRRWSIIDFPNEFSEGRDVTESISEEEYRNLARKCVKILPELIKRNSFTNQGTIQQRMQAYIMHSNPLPYFVEHYCEENVSHFTKGTEFYNAYCAFLKERKLRRVSMREMKSAMIDLGLDYDKRHVETGQRDGQGFEIKERVYCVVGVSLNSYF